MVLLEMRHVDAQVKVQRNKTHNNDTLRVAQLARSVVRTSMSKAQRASATGFC
jgi:hypothetical protein